MRLSISDQFHSNL